MTKTAFFLSLLKIAIAIIPLTALGDQPFSFQTIIVSNQEVPGVVGATIGTIGTDYVSPGFFYDNQPYINSSGQVTFIATIEGPGVDDGSNLVLLAGEKDALQLVIREGDPATGFVGEVDFGEFFRRFWIDDNGGVTSFVNVTGDGITGNFNHGLFSNTSGFVDLLLADGDVAPNVGFGIEMDTNPEISRLGSNGHLLLSARLFGAGVNESNNTILYLLHDDVFETLMREGDQAPGLPPGVNYGSTPVRIAINANGESGFHSWLSNGQNAIFVNNNGQTEPYLVSGTDAPGAGLGVVFDVIDDYFAFNDAGQVSFVANLDDGTEDYLRAIYSESSGTMELLAITGQQAPGLLPSQFFFAPLYPLINGNGETAFMSTLSGALINDDNDSGIWAEVDGELKLVVRESIPVPNSPSEKFWNLHPVGYASDGSFYFLSRLGPDSGFGNDRALFMYRDNQLRLIVREGQMFDVNDDPLVEEFRVVEQLHLQGVLSLEYGHSAGFNESGQFAFSLTFDDETTGVFVASPALMGDLNADGSVNLLDIAPFVNALTGGFYVQTGDVNCDGVVDLLDVTLFVDLLTD